MKEIKLTQGKVALVDDEDYERVDQFKWTAIKLGHSYYAVRQFWTGGKHQNILMHRFILGDSTHEIDHKNNDGLDNRKCNIRYCTRTENLRNRLPFRGGSSAYKGVRKPVNYNKYIASIRVCKKPIHIGVFINEIDAAKAYDNAVKKYFGDFGYLNFPD